MRNSRTSGNCSCRHALYTKPCGFPLQKLEQPEQDEQLSLIEAVPEPAEERKKEKEKKKKKKK